MSHIISQFYCGSPVFCESKVLLMLIECLVLWVPLAFRQGELALSSIQRRVEQMLWSVFFQPIANTYQICLALGKIFSLK